MITDDYGNVMDCRPYPQRADQRMEAIEEQVETVDLRVDDIEARLAAVERKLLEAHWPGLESVPCGRDLFAVYPVHGLPQPPVDPSVVEWDNTEYCYAPTEGA